MLKNLHFMLKNLHFRSVFAEAARTNSIFVGVGAKADGEFIGANLYDDFRVFCDCFALILVHFRRTAMEYGHNGVTAWDDKTGPEYGNHTRRPGLGE